MNGEILSKDRVIGKVQDGLLVSFDEQRLPFYLLRTKDVEAWLRGRAIDAHRTNSRLLKRALRIGSTDDMDAVLRVRAATVTDTYWFRAEGDAVHYDDVRFKENLFASLALRGDPDSFNQPYSHTPELTNTGSYEKCWRLENGRWRMIKRGNELERFSELLICRVGQALGFPMAAYTAQEDTVVSPDFTGGGSVNFESAAGLVGDSEDYAENFEAFWNLSLEMAKQYLQIIYMDALCFNMDRHTQNYGILRDPDSGAVLSMAPNFDNNIALFSRKIPENLARTNDKLIGLYLELLEQDDRAPAIAPELPAPTWELVRECGLETGVDVPETTVTAAADFIMAGSDIIQDKIKSLLISCDEDEEQGQTMM